MENFEKRKNEWLESVSNDCHQFALKTNLDFYVFQTPIFYNPKLLIIGINPGGGKTYSEVLSEKNIDRRTSETLFYGENTLFEKPKWEIEGKLKGSDVLRDRLKRIFNEKNDFLGNSHCCCRICRSPSDPYHGLEFLEHLWCEHQSNPHH